MEMLTFAVLQTRFGCVYVDYKDNCKRYPKQSAKVLKDIFKKYIQ